MKKESGWWRKITKYNSILKKKCLQKGSKMIREEWNTNMKIKLPAFKPSISKELPNLKIN